MEGCRGDWLYGLSPAWTKAVMVSTAIREMRIKDTTYGATLAPPARNDTDLESGEVYEITFDSETRFYLKIDRPGQHIRISYDVIT